MKLLIKNVDNDGRLALIPEFLETSWTIEVANHEDRTELGHKLEDADAMISMNWPGNMPRAPALKLLHLPGAGTDDIAFDSVPAQAAVCNVFEHEIGIAEYVLSAMLQWEIAIPRMDAALRRGEWYGSHLSGPRHGELYGQTLGIIGYGRIGREVATRARAFGMNVLACSRTPGPGDGLVKQVEPMGKLDELLATSDFVLLALPLDSTTAGLIGRERIAKMKPTAVIINVARGALIDENALYEACREQRIGGAVIDTWYRYPAQGETRSDPSSLPFRDLDNVIMTPHGSGWTKGLLPRRCRLIAQNLDRLARGEPLVNVVRQPTAAR
ncbi:MAG: NAD(P)-binding domain-containing protein [Prolixibacteraceae bacterium]|nr:NAD(P)-binding domain-containing protein [Burkholderiales bacterium]